jgi:hypothetical protein
MKPFDSRWEALVARAREAGQSTSPVEPPPGFTTRVLAQARAESADANQAVEELWMVRIRQGFAMVTAVGLALITLEFATHRSHGFDHPRIENTVAQLLWRL